MVKVIQKVSQIIKDNKYLWKPCLILFVIYLVAISAILFSRVHYADDIGRTQFGYHQFSYFNRYINEVLCLIFHTDVYLANIAPLPQLMAVLILAIVSVIVVCTIVGKNKFKEPCKKWIWIIIASVPIGLSPYMLECLSYQYDSVYMAFSVLFAVFPLIFRKRTIVQYTIAICVGTIGVCMTYQASVGIFLIMIVFLAIKEWNEKKTKFKEGLKCFGKEVVFPLAIFGLMLVCFKLFLVTPRDFYVSNGLLGVQEFIPGLLSHLKRYVSLLLSDFRLLWSVMVWLIAGMFIVIFVVRSQRNKILAMVVSVCGLALMLVCAFVVYASLSKPLFSPRSMYAVGVLFAVISIYMVNNKTIWILKMPVFVLCWCFFIFALIYGNALSEQDKYLDTRINMVVSDLNELKIIKDDVTTMIWITGDMGTSPIISNMPQDYGALERLIGESFYVNIWAARRLMILYDVGNLVFEEDNDLDEMDLPVVKSTALYDIKADDKNVLVVFKGGEE